jgi:hypothetical protein
LETERTRPEASAFRLGPVGQLRTFTDGGPVRIDPTDGSIDPLGRHPSLATRERIAMKTGLSRILLLALASYRSAPRALPVKEAIVSLGLLIAAAISPTVAATAQDRAHPVGLEEGFQNVPTPDKPWAYWWWLKGNVTKESITADLEAMKKVGFSGFLMFDARGYHEGHVPPPPSRMEFMSPPWRQMLKFSIAEASRLGLEVSVNLSSCAGALKGPWPVGDDAPKRLIWTSAEVHGPRRLSCRLQPGATRFWDVAVLAVRTEEPAGAVPVQGEVDLSGPWREVLAKEVGKEAATEVLDLADKLDRQGRLAWQVPPGRWTILRFGCALMEGHEYDVDVLDHKAVTAHFNRMGKAVLDDAGPHVGKALTHFYSVSWEGAAPTWTLGLDAAFRAARGYCPRPYLPVLAGYVVKSPDVSRRFLRDYHKTLGDCFMNNFYGTLRDLCHRQGLKWHSESGGPWNRKLAGFEQADQLAFLARNDVPQGEFWYLGQAMNRPAAMAAHVYGLRLAAVEAFTHMRWHWSAYPGGLKGGADAAFCDGANQFIWHTFTASLPEFGQPGSEYFAGTHINPRITWWREAPAFLDYLARCQFLLRQGKFVADVCCYTGDNPYLHWGRGAKWSEKPTLALDNGYAYDLINTEALLARTAVEGGDLVLSDGMRYRLLVVDLADTEVPPAALCKIRDLAHAGAKVVLGRRRPQRAIGLSGYPACDHEIQDLAAELWGPADRPSGRRPLGKGEVFSGMELDEVLRQRKVLPDLVGPFDYTHRRTADADVYFLAGKGRAECVFRVHGREPELWDPVTGNRRDALHYRPTDDGRTAVPIELPESGAVCVVFRRPAERVRLESVAGPEGGLELCGRTREGLSARLWRPGDYRLRTSEGRETVLAVPSLPGPMELRGPWRVQFEAGRGAPESAVFDQLAAWDTHPDSRIKYFSGTATYQTTFEQGPDQVGHAVRLCLGDVKFVARIMLNGQDLGVAWTAPWIVDLTKAVRPGMNKLTVHVTNLWVNRLIGDAGLPVPQRVGRTNVLLKAGRRDFRAYQGFASEDSLMSSGWIGPARIEFGRDQKLSF